jgi:hypothetical protein
VSAKCTALLLAALLLAAGCGREASGTAGGCPSPSASPTASAAGQATSQRATDDPSAVASYWTDERMRSAKPAPMPSKEKPKPTCEH